MESVKFALCRNCMNVQPVECQTLGEDGWMVNIMGVTCVKCGEEDLSISQEAQRSIVLLQLLEMRLVNVEGIVRVTRFSWGKRRLAILTIKGVSKGMLKVVKQVLILFHQAIG